jgi:hypothetical protein
VRADTLMTNTQPHRELVLDLLRGGGAHLSLEDALGDFPPALRGTKPRGSPHTPWQILEHMRIAQWDILKYSLDPEHRSPDWPSGYWPPTASPPEEDAWNESVRAFFADLARLEELAADPKLDLLAPIPHARDATLLGELYLVASHNSYHLGQLMLLRRMQETSARE